MRKSGFFSAKRITGMAVLLALVIVLQLFGSYIKIGATPLSFILVPIVLGGVLYGPIAGGLLGFAFGFIVFMQGVSGVDGFTAILIQDHPIYTALLCMGKGVAAGVVPAFVYRWLAKKNEYVAVISAAVCAPIVNTGLFVLGALAFLQDTLQANFTDGTSVLYFLIIVCAGVNFLVEFAINLVASPSIYRVINIITGRKNVKIDIKEDENIAPCDGQAEKTEDVVEQ